MTEEQRSASSLVSSALPVKTPQPQGSEGPTAANQARLTDGIFKFLRDTFNQMPMPVRVFGWVTLLFLFLILVLHPVLGITYFQGKVTVLQINDRRETEPQPGKSIKIQKETHTFTNEEGEFIIPVRAMTLPLMRVKFDFIVGDHRETVPLPAPVPLLSLFDVNAATVWYVPGSKRRDRLGAVQRYFTEVNEAASAIKELTASTSPNVALAYSSLARSGVLSLPVLGVAYAATVDSEDHAVVRVRRIRMTSNTAAQEIDVDIAIDNKPVRPSTNHGSYSTVLIEGIAAGLRNLDLPLPKVGSQVQLRLFTKRSWFARSELASVTFQPERIEPGKVITVQGKDVQVETEVLPPVSLKSTAVPGTDRAHWVNIWVNTPKEFVKYIVEVKYTTEFGKDINPVIPYKEALYGWSRIMYQSAPISALVVFVGGSSRKITKFVSLEHRDPNDWLDYYFYAKTYLLQGDLARARELVETSLRLDPRFIPSLQLRGSIAAKAGLTDEAIATYERAIAIAPDNASLLNSFAWLVADSLPTPTRQQLDVALIRVEKAIQLNPNPSYYDTLGWLHVRLGQRAEALKALEIAREMLEGELRTFNTWQEVNFHLGKVYVDAGRPGDAKEAFLRVVEYAAKAPPGSNPKTVEEANRWLRGLK
jgi:tetratricopeptide (TPR) repeat protein